VRGIPSASRAKGAGTIGGNLVSNLRPLSDRRIHTRAGVSCALGLALGVSACGGASVTSAPSSHPNPLRVTLSAPTHRPLVGAAWTIAIRAAGSNGRPLRAVVRYQYLFAGTVVAHRSRYRFMGIFHDTIRWPARSAGVPLTFRALVRTALGTRKLDYPVMVKR
jgi:hypothetical protein